MERDAELTEFVAAGGAALARAAPSSGQGSQ
jgi:hypothetical protein